MSEQKMFPNTKKINELEKGDEVNLVLVNPHAWNRLAQSGVLDKLTVEDSGFILGNVLFQVATKQQQNNAIASAKIAAMKRNPTNKPMKVKK